MPDSTYLPPDSDNRQSSGLYLALIALEAALNGALALDPQARVALCHKAGLSIRIKLLEPYFVFYLLIDDDGIEVRDQFDGKVDIQLSAPAHKLALFILASSLRKQPALREYGIRVRGRAETLRELGGILDHYDLWHNLRQWLEEQLPLTQLRHRLENNDPQWTEELERLGALIADSVREMRQQHEQLERHLQQMADYVRISEDRRRMDLACLLVSMLLFMLATLIAGQHPDNTSGLQLPALSLLLMFAGGGLVLLRLLRSVK